MRIGIVGAGAIGSVVGGLLTNAGHDSDPSNLMAAGAIRNFTDTLTTSQISKIQKSPYVS